MIGFLKEVVPTADAKLSDAILAHLNDLTKPLGSLGYLEELATCYCLCKASARAKLESMKVLTFAGDHGVTAERITPFPSEVTRQMVMNMAAGGAAVSVMCRSAGIDYSVVDVGVNGDFEDMQGLIRQKVARGTANFRLGPAMTREQAARAMKVGYDLAANSRADLIGLGDMGIGNTSASSALYSLFLGLDPAETVGPGTGSSGGLLAKKVRVVSEALSLHRKEWDGSGLDALCRVGGFEIAAITGAVLGGAANRIPTVIDGFIASAGALAAIRLVPTAMDYLFFSHVSGENFHRKFLASQSIRPILDLDMRLGEGTGAVLAMQVIQQAMACYEQMATFSSAGVSNSV